MPNIHARFSPSAANRRIHCPPSLLLEEQFEEGESVYAAEGTAGHAMAEHLLRKYLKQRTKRPTSEFYTDELLEAVDEYVSFVIGEIEDARRTCKSPVLLVEQRVDASEYVDSCFGTADMVIITDKANVAHIIDLKLGKGVEVHAEGNPQLMIYGLGVLNMAEALYDIETVRMTIFQPRLGNSSTWSVSPEYLKRWGEEVLRPAGAQALMGAGDFSAGTWCRFCRARNQCRARAESFLEMAKMEFKRPTLLSDEEVAEVIAKADELSKWAADVYAFAQDEAILHGKRWPGYKVVEGRSARRYASDEEVIHSPSERVKPVGENVSAGVGEGMSGYDFSEDAASLAASVETAVTAALPQDALASLGTAAAQGLSDAMTGYSMSGTGSAIASNVRTAVNGSLTGVTLRSAGVNAMAGLRAGILAGQSGVIAAMHSAARAALNAAKSELKIHSPSQVFEDEVGVMTMRGLGRGVLKESKAQAKIIRNASRFLTGEAREGSISTTSNDNRRTYNNSVNSTIQVQQMVVRDEQDIRSLAVEIATLTRRQQRGKGLRMA